MKYFQSETALSKRIMEGIIEEAAQEATDTARVNVVLEGVASYIITDLLETIAELEERGTLRTADDIFNFMYGLLED